MINTSMKSCKTCQSSVPDKRWEMGYRVCVDCSTESKWSAIQVIHHKTGNETQVVKDPEVAAEFYAKSARTGFGTLKGMTKTYKSPTQSKDVTVDPIPPKPLPESKILERKSLPNDYENVGNEVMCYLEKGLTQEAIQHIEKARLDKRIFGIHERQLKQIVEALTISKI